MQHYGVSQPNNKNNFNTSTAVPPELNVRIIARVAAKGQLEETVAHFHVLAYSLPGRTEVN
jgi:hypothetical protein